MRQSDPTASVAENDEKFWNLGCKTIGKILKMIVTCLCWDVNAFLLRGDFCVFYIHYKNLQDCESKASMG